MAQVNVNIRMDADLKKQFEAFCSDVGMNMTTAFCVFAKTVVRERRIPFEITADHDSFYSSSNIKRLEMFMEKMENIRLRKLAESRNQDKTSSFEDFVKEEGFSMEELEKLADSVEIE